MEDNEEEVVRPEDDLAVNMCSTMLVPRLNALIAGGAFDAFSSVQIPWLIDMAEQVEASLGTENIRFSVGAAMQFRLCPTEYLSSPCSAPWRENLGRTEPV